MSDGSDSSDTGKVKEVKLLSSIGAKDLVKLGNVTKGGWLKRKTLRGTQRLSIGSIAWRTLYCCIADGCMYHFESNTSKGPKTAFALTEYNRVFRVENQQRENCFEIQPLLGDNSRKTYMFSCENDDDRLDWMRSVYHALLVGNHQLPPDKHVLVKYGYDDTEKSVLMEAPESNYSNLQVLKEEKATGKPKVDRYNPWDKLFTDKSGDKESNKPNQTRGPSSESDDPVYVNQAGLLYENQLVMDEEEEEGEEETEQEDYLFESSDGNAARALLADKVLQTFVVRNSREEGRKILVVKRKEKCQQHIINIKDDVYFIEQTAQFGSLHELINYYKQNELCGCCIGNGYKFYDR